VLAPGASPGSCHGIDQGTCNLYLWHNGTLIYIAGLNANRIGGSSGDADNWLPVLHPSGDSQREKTARVSPDGKTLLFRSTQSLTGYPNAGFDEFYRYDATSGQIGCVSCNPTGASPTGPAALRSLKTVAEFSAHAPILTRNLSADGSRVFFESPDALVPQDTNGNGQCTPASGGLGGPSCQDVYEWERSGAGSCQRAGGCLYLISTGKSPDPSYFADASANGDDVFFFTDESLVDQDRDGLVDIYDARVGGGIASQSAPPLSSCSGETCRLPASLSPVEQTPSSSAFTGPGNPAPSQAHAGKKKHRAHTGKKKHQRSHGKQRHRHRAAGRSRGGSR
jgi:WD40-like Beta Propeller Repeat